jgi:hypothetical protein
VGPYPTVLLRKIFSPAFHAGSFFLKSQSHRFDISAFLIFYFLPVGRWLAPTNSCGMAQPLPFVALAKNGAAHTAFFTSYAGAKCKPDKWILDKKAYLLDDA